MRAVINENEITEWRIVINRVVGKINIIRGKREGNLQEVMMDDSRGKLYLQLKTPHLYHALETSNHHITTPRMIVKRINNKNINANALRFPPLSKGRARKG